MKRDLCKNIIKSFNKNWRNAKKLKNYYKKILLMFAMVLWIKVKDYQIIFLPDKDKTKIKKLEILRQ